MSWHLNANTFHVPTRMRYGDEVADRQNEFRRNGYQRLPTVPRESVVSIYNQIKNTPALAEGTLQHFETDTLLTIPEFKAIATAPEILNIAAMWLGAEPKVIDVSAWRSTVTGDTPEGAQMWHRDMDDWRACKLFMYLTDVGPENGPHMFVPGSHRREFFEDRDLPPDRFFVGASRSDVIEAQVDTFPRVEFCGPAGTLWLENTYGFHRGRPVTKGERAVFQVLYALTEYKGSMSKTGMIREAWRL